MSLFFAYAKNNETILGQKYGKQSSAFVNLNAYFEKKVIL
jgi:hypothetical protein